MSRVPRARPRALLSLSLTFSLLLLGSLPAVTVSAQPRIVHVGIVLDGPWARNDELLDIFLREIRALIRTEFDLRFLPRHQLTGDFTEGGIAAAADRLLADPEVDLVLSLGPVASAHIGRMGPLPKPVVAGFVLNPEVEGIPVQVDARGERVSGVPNLSYLTFSGDLPAELRRFREVVPFDRLTMLVNEGLTAAVPELSTNLRQRMAALGIEFDVVPVGADLDAALKAIPEGTEAVYLVPLIQLADEAFERLVAALIGRRLPSFSFWGRSEVERGLLTSLYLDADFVRVGRRLALHVQRILLGEDGGTLPVDFPRSTRLTMNVATARAIGISPSWSVFTEAELLDAERPGARVAYDLAGVARAALAVNLDVAAADRSVEAGRQQVRRARAPLLPQLSVSALGQVIDEDRAAAGFGGQPRRLFAGSATVSQLLYAEPTRAGAEVEASRQREREASRDQLRLDVVLDATIAYLDVLRAQTFERIQRDNLSVTRSHLEMARARQEVGVARASEVIRWENQIATNRREVIDASARRNLAEVALNRLLDRPLEEPFQVSPAELDDPALATSAPQLAPYLDNPFAFDLFRDFMAAEARAASPELRRLDALVAAEERTLLSARRAFWQPTVSLQGDYTALARGGTGSVTPMVPLFSFTQPDSLNWTVSVRGSLPLFTGGARRAAREGTAATLAERRATRDATADRIEQAVRSALHLAGASFAGIELAGEAARAARRNLALVTDAYSQGAVPVIDLLDAQNAALVADQGAASAVFDYLVDLMGVQRAVGRFDFFVPPEERQEFRQRLDRFFENAGYRRRMP